MSDLKKIQILINPEIYKKFKEICKEEDIPASIKIRHFMKEYVAKYEEIKYGSKNN